MSFLYGNNLITKQQHGFVNKKACAINFLDTLTFDTKTISKLNSLDILFLDFAKAFDKVSHQRLIYKLSAYGINGNLFRWIKSDWKETTFFTGVLVILSKGRERCSTRISYRSHFIYHQITSQTLASFTQMTLRYWHK